MAPEQFHGKAVFASDVYSIGVTMYQLLTGQLPYESPKPEDLEKLERGDFTTSPRLRNPKIPKAISDIVLKAMAPEITARYPRAHDLLDAILAARPHATGRRPWPAAAAGAGAREPAKDIRERLKARETPPARFCWHCGKPLHARTGSCPFCGETQ
jgi:serine/threonine-protein kinase